MAIIRFTQGDKMAAQVADTGPQTATITEIDGPKASKSGKSNTIYMTFTATLGKYQGKEYKIALNSEVNSGSLLGGMQFLPQRELLNIAAASANIPLKDVPFDLDTEELVGRSLDLNVGVEAAEGVLHNVILAFAPAGTLGKSPF